MTALPSPGAIIGGKYRILRLIGEGGMGAVYEARHEHLGSSVALKFLHPELSQRPGIVARFLQEGRVSASIKSIHVTQVMDVDQTPDGSAYLVMELLEGETLESRLERGKPLPLFDAVEIGLQILSALEVAHARGIVHRDLKPDNVWLTPSAAGPVVKLLDFGIAKLKASTEVQQVSTRPGSIMGTPAYMAPEQAISADQVDHRADLYSFGVMLYEMLSGKRPIVAENPQDVISALARGDVAPLSAQNPHVPPNLSALVDMLVAPNPDKRPANATTVREELLRFTRVSAPPSNRPSGFESNTVMTLEPTAGFNAVPGKGTQAMQPQVPAWQPPPIVAQPAWNERQSYPVPPQFQPPNPQWQPQSPAPPATWQARPPATDPSWGAPQGAPMAPIAPPRKRSGKWWVLGVFVAALAGGGIWLSQNPSVLDTSAPPPYPTALPSAVIVPAPIDPGLLPSRPAAPRVEVTPSPRSPSAPAVPKFPFTLPSTLPPLPSNLPDLIPQIPGVTIPANPAAAPAAPTVAPAPAPT